MILMIHDTVTGTRERAIQERKDQGGGHNFFLPTLRRDPQQDVLFRLENDCKPKRVLVIRVDRCHISK